jgi:hypothetical protein
VIFGYLRTLFVRVCGINDLGHTCDEYSVLFTKSGLTLHAATPEPAWDARERGPPQ